MSLFHKKNTATEKQNPEKTSKVTPQFLNLIYISVIVLCGILMLALIIITANRLQKNNELKAEEAAIVEKYNDLAEKHENLTDPDYAEVYFEGNNLYIPAQDIIIEYQP